MGIATGSMSVKGAEVRSVYIPLTDIMRTVAPLHTKNKAVTGDNMKGYQIMLSMNGLDLAAGTLKCYQSKIKKSPIEGFCKDIRFSETVLRFHQYPKYHNATLLLIHHRPP